jgi:IS1 family transposase
VYPDHWDAYAAVLLSQRHRAIDTGHGETNHIEWCNTILHQQCSALVRKTLSFRRSHGLHQKQVRLFINQYNKGVSV